MITYQELLRGPLPASMQAILLVGLDQPDETWHWGTNLAPILQKFLDRGGRIAVITKGPTAFDGDAAVRMDGDVVADLDAVLAALGAN